MQISSRFTEYGLTGGFFWICQLILICWFGQTRTVLSTVQKQIQDGISPVVSTGVSALAIIAVFVTGLLLDLFAVYFRPMEMRVFRRHLVRNRDWLGRLITYHKAYCETDYEEFDRRYCDIPLMKDMRASLDAFVFWNREKRERYVAALKRGWGWDLARPYERLWSFFASYIVVLSGSSQLSLLVDQYYLWRAGRAVSTVLVIVFLQVQFVFLPKLPHTSALFLLAFLLPLALSALAAVITLGTYSRLCFTLFALVYVTQDKTRSEAEAVNGNAASPQR